MRWSLLLENKQAAELWAARAEWGAYAFLITVGVCALLAAACGLVYIKVNKHLQVFVEKETAQQAELALIRRKEIEEKNLQLAIQLEQERRSRLELEQAARSAAVRALLPERPRRLTPEQQEKIVQALAGSPGHTLSIVSRAADHESRSLAGDFASALKQAGWQISSEEEAKLEDGTRRGVWIIVKDRKAIPPGATLFAEALKQAGVAWSPAINPKMPEDRFELRIGSR